MQSTTRILTSFALVSAAAIVMASAPYAVDDHAPSSSTGPLRQMRGR